MEFSGGELRRSSVNGCQENAPDPSQERSGDGHQLCDQIGWFEGASNAKRTEVAFRPRDLKL